MIKREIYQIFFKHFKILILNNLIIDDNTIILLIKSCLIVNSNQF